MFTAGIVRVTLFGGATLISDRDFASGSAVVVVGGVRKSCCYGFSIIRFSDLRPNNCFSNHAIRTLSCWFSSVSVLYSSRNANKVVVRVASDAGSFDSLAPLLLGDVVMRGLIKAVQKSAKNSFVTFFLFQSHRATSATLANPILFYIIGYGAIKLSLFQSLAPNTELDPLK